VTKESGTLPITVTLAPAETDGDGMPVQCLPGLSGGAPDANAAALPGFTVVHLHGALTAAPTTAGRRTSSPPASTR
jgi:hypothetical protein